MQDLTITSQLIIPAEELEVTFVRSSGPGGQNVNKVNSKVRLSWPLLDNSLLPEPWKQRVVKAFGSRITSDGRLTLVSQQYRDQARNLQDVRLKLKEMLLSCQHPPKTRKATKPTLGSRLRRLDGKKQLGQKKRLRKPPEA